MNADNPAAELDEVMLAMDVVDTIRHRELIVERELNSEERREKLIERLKSLYAAQGLEVSDHVLAKGVEALEEDRFAYDPPESGFQTWLAHRYVNRGRWGKPLLAVLAIAVAVFVAWQLMVVRPEAARIAGLPLELQTSFETVIAAASTETAVERANDLLTSGSAALDRGDTDGAAEAIDGLRSLEVMLEQRYELHIVSRPGELSGVWRVPDANPSARNYYLIVEAIDDDGNVLSMPVRNEEDGKIYTVDKWGIRVDREIFERVAADKSDDGILQDYVLGTKERGTLQPDYRVPTTGAAIVSW